MSYLALLISDNFRGVEKFELGALSPATLKETYFCMGSEILFIATCSSDLTFFAYISEVNRAVSPNWGP